MLPGLVFVTGPVPVPASRTRVVSGLSDSGVSSVRVHAHTVYNEGLPASLVDQFALDGTMLPTTGTAAVSVVSPTGAGPDRDVHTTTTGYDPIVTGGVSGWVLRKPTSTTVAMNGAGPDLVSQTVYDQFGSPTESRPPSDSTGTTAATTNTVYYTADGSATVTACGNHPEWEGLVCWSGPAAQPTGGTSLLDTLASNFDWYTNVIAMSNQTPAGATLRSTTSSFDSAGRPTGSSVTSSVAGDVPVPDSTISYARNTGLPLSTSAGGESVSTGFDSWTQPVSYTDASGNASSTTYDLAGRASTHSDGKGTYSYTYDTAGEHRGLVTSMTAGVGGGLPDGFTVTYDAGGNPVNVAYPNGVTATMGYDTVGLLTGRQYTDHAGVSIAAWVLSRDGWGRVVEQSGPSGSGSRVSGFGYDPAGRLTNVVDQSGTTCTGRGYGFDTGFNRLTRTVTSATAVSGVCPAGSTVSTTTGVFNTASQLLSTTVAGAGAATGSYVYDGLGRTTTVPAIDTSNPAGENLTLGFHSTDKPATQTLGGTVQSFGLDPVGRTDTTTVTTGTTSTTTVSFFDGGSDSPAWSETGGSWTRFTGGPDGSLALQVTGTGPGTEPISADLMLISPHGDIAATIPDTTDVPAAQMSGINDTDEYGNVETPPAPTPYGWEGAAQRSTADQAGIILMGARQYNPASGRFLTIDPIPGGNPNPYTYPADPVSAGVW